MSGVKIESATDLTHLLKSMPTRDPLVEELARERQNSLTKPAGSLGRLEEIAIWLAGWHQREKPSIDNAACVVFAGNHGVAAQGVSAFPPEVTEQMVLNFENGGAAINQLSALSGASLNVVSLNLDRPTKDFSVEPAMNEQECCDAMQTGVMSVPHDADILLLGEMGIANTTAAAAVAQSTFGGRAKDWVGRGTGIDDDSLKLKYDVVNCAVKLHGADQKSAFDIMRTVGGRELAAITGAVIEARHRRLPVILDGFISTAAAAVLCKENINALDHALISHQSVEQGHRNLIGKLGKRPILDLDMRLGEASGAAVALMIVKAALATHNGMATFAQAGVSENE